MCEFGEKVAMAGTNWDIGKVYNTSVSCGDAVLGGKHYVDSCGGGLWVQAWDGDLYEVAHAFGIRNGV
jgi:hypothetical protein